MTAMFVHISDIEAESCMSAAGVEYFTSSAAGPEAAGSTSDTNSSALLTTKGALPPYYQCQCFS